MERGLLRNATRGVENVEGKNRLSTIVARNNENATSNNINSSSGCEKKERLGLFLIAKEGKKEKGKTDRKANRAKWKKASKGSDNKAQIIVL